jgi:hypothetical protein
MDTFVVTEPFYDVCESWAEEPETQAWDELYPIIAAWLIRSN